MDVEVEVGRVCVCGHSADKHADYERVYQSPCEKCACLDFQCRILKRRGYYDAR